MADGGGRRAVRRIDYQWIPVRDGTRLAARIWLPEDAAADPVPGILEAVPYRLSDGMAPRDVRVHPYWAAHGYACVRVDLRGSGESGRRPRRRVPAPGAGGPARGHRLDRGAAVVHRSRRHDRHLLGRLQQPAARRSPAAGAEGDHHAHEHRRPLRRRRALQGRLRDGHRPAPLELLHAPLAVPAAERGGGRRRRGASSGCSASRRTRRGCTPGSPTSAGTRTGSTARCARTTAPSRSPCTRSAAGPTATPTRCSGCSRACTGRARA